MIDERYQLAAKIIAYYRPIRILIAKILITILQCKKKDAEIKDDTRGSSFSI